MSHQTDLTSPPADASDTPTVLLTGAGGEIGHGLIERLRAQSDCRIVALDRNPLPRELATCCDDVVACDIRDRAAVEAVFDRHQFSVIYHLAALLSTTGEKSPDIAHDVNVGGTLILLQLAARQQMSTGLRARLLFPSTIAVYGMPDLQTKHNVPAVREDEWCVPITMYGCNKLYCEHLGRYYTKHYMQLAEGGARSAVDFRAIRFPGIISATTVPTGGTSDFAPEMIHAAAEGKPYTCFVREDARIPFMTMPDAVDALLGLAAAEEASLSQRVYNVTSFHPSAGEVRDLVNELFTESTGSPPRITFEPHPARQAIVDSWPANTDDSAARRDWGYAPKHDLDAAFREYLVPVIKARYASAR